jgi:hypothetical protein
MRPVKASKAPNDSVNPACIKPVSTQQIQALIKFLPIFEDIKPEDLACVVKPR